MTTVKVLDENQIPTVMINVKAMAKVQQYVMQSSKEVGWMGLVTPHTTENGIILELHDPYAPAQEVSATTTDLDSEGEGSFLEWAINLGDNANKIKWWGHSHVNMGVSPSGTDLTTFYEHIENDPDNPFIMTIHNKINASYCNMYLGGGVYAENVLLNINYSSKAIRKAVKQELEANVREKVYNAKPKTTNGYNPGGTTGYGASAYTGGGSNWKQSSQSGIKNRNAQSNIMGLRSR